GAAAYVGGGAAVIFLGIDPGFAGAVAALADSQDAPMFFDLPTLRIEGAKRNHTEYDLRGIVRILRGWEASQVRIAVEFVRGVPNQRVIRQGSQSIWLQGHGVGVIEGVIAGLGLPYERVSPQRWRKALGASGGEQAKEASRLLALQLFPAVADQLA